MIRPHPNILVHGVRVNGLDREDLLLVIEYLMLKRDHLGAKSERAERLRHEINHMWPVEEEKGS